MTVTAIASLYLLSVLGVEGDEDSTVVTVGLLLGFFSLISAGIIHMAMLVLTRNSHQHDATVESSTTQRSVRAIFSGKVEEDMFVAALI